MNVFYYVRALHLQLSSDFDSNNNKRISNRRFGEQIGNLLKEFIKLISLCVTNQLNLFRLGFRRLLNRYRILFFNAFSNGLYLRRTHFVGVNPIILYV